MSNNEYHATRLSPDVRRTVLWRTLVESFFQAHIGAGDCVLDLGAGYGDFINNVRARSRIAVDIWPGMMEHLAEGVTGLVTDVCELTAIPDGSVDIVLASNILEHLAHDDAERCIRTIRAKMKDGGGIHVLQPNFRYAHREYFDDYTHRTIWTDVGLCDLLTAHGFRIVQCRPSVSASNG